jgi:hypothetical protein
MQESCKFGAISYEIAGLPAVLKKKTTSPLSSR